MFNLYHICYAHLVIFTWNLRDKNVNYYYYYKLLIIKLLLLPMIEQFFDTMIVASSDKEWL